MLNRDSKIGGHVGPNLGIVETTIALHYVFNSPEDKIVYDVSHQSYPHKILTGRKNGFLTDEGMREISGYTNPAESEHDHFIVGHTSTSVSLVCGLAKARDLKGEKYNIIAVIGDGSLSGGEALEGFDNAAVLNSNIIIIVNDNEMSIAENHGGLYGNLRLLRQTGGRAECNMFKALGFDYRYLEESNAVVYNVNNAAAFDNSLLRPETTAPTLVPPSSTCCRPPVICARSETPPDKISCKPPIMVASSSVPETFSRPPRETIKIPPLMTVSCA